MGKDVISKFFKNKKGDDDLTLGPQQLLYLIIIITFLVILIAIISSIKNNLK